jgi:preprotein translocase subunit SecG
MVEIIRNVVLVIYVIVCIVLIVLATIQAKDQSGVSQTVTGAAANNFYEQNKGRTKEGKLKRLTVFSGVLFVILAVALSILMVM